MTATGQPTVRVLVCDDDPILSHALATLIEYNLGMELVTPPVATAQAAIEAVIAYHPDVVLMDVQLMGGMDGYEATAMIRELSPTTNVVIISGMANLEHALTNSMEAGAADFLPKTDASTNILRSVRAAGRSNRGAAAT